MLILELFLTFFMLGFVSFGGGYVMIPLIQEEVVERHGWMTLPEFTEVIAVAGMSPGPIATNSAVFVGFAEAGIPGAVAAALGTVLPSLLIILVLGFVFYKIREHTAVKSAFYGLRAIITGLIVYTAFLFAYSNDLITSISWHTVSLLIIYAGSLLALIRFKIHPIYVILGSGLIGMAFYS
jgi:chromate transporter